nr:PREDICTED: odorant receptor Or1-like [Tribolium castaneum]|eukprot:XP_015839897.1 PREDICTED: odorant receptor Or1-like [Tribolium castaneum]
MGLEGRNLPLEIWVPVDFTENTELYCFAYIYVVLGVAAGALSNGVIDPLIAGLASHATTQLKILKNNLQFLSEDADQVIAQQLTKARIIQDKIRFCIIHHNAILDFVDYYENVYSGIVFSQFIASVFVICLACFYLSIVEPFSVIFFAMVIFLVTVLSQIFLYSYYGTLLFEENNTLTNAVYMGQWYTYDVTSRKALIILMERSKRPMTVRAGKVLDLSLETFTTILRRAYSLLAVLKNY